MITNQIIKLKLNSGENINVDSLMLSDSENYYRIDTIIFLGGSNDITDITIDDKNLQFSGGFILNQINMFNITVNTSTYGVLLIGVKTKKTIFN